MTSLNNDTNSTISASQRLAFELNGTLANTAGDNTLFSLYLAMHDAREPHTVKFAECDEAHTDNELAHLKYYRVAALQLSEQAVTHHHTQNALRQQRYYQSALLHECLHPTPIHHRNDATFIDEQIQTNASLASQWALRSDTQTAVLETDATLLADIVEPSQSML